MEGKPILVLLHVPFTGSDDFVFKTKGGKEGWYFNCIASTSTCRRSDSYQGGEAGEEFCSCTCGSRAMTAYSLLLSKQSSPMSHWASRSALPLDGDAFNGLVAKSGSARSLPLNRVRFTLC